MDRRSSVGSWLGSRSALSVVSGSALEEVGLGAQDNVLHDTAVVKLIWLHYVGHIESIVKLFRA